MPVARTSLGFDLRRGAISISKTPECWTQLGTVASYISSLCPDPRRPGCTRRAIRRLDSRSIAHHYDLSNDFPTGCGSAANARITRAPISVRRPTRWSRRRSENRPYPQQNPVAARRTAARHRLCGWGALVIRCCAEIWRAASASRSRARSSTRRRGASRCQFAGSLRDPPARLS